MPAFTCEALHALLAQMRSIHGNLDRHDAGICVLHLEAAIAALESHLRRSPAPAIGEQPRDGASRSLAH
jgi:hypothetical protein